MTTKEKVQKMKDELKCKYVLVLKNGERLVPIYNEAQKEALSKYSIFSDIDFFENLFKENKSYSYEELLDAIENHFDILED